MTNRHEGSPWGSRRLSPGNQVLLGFGLAVVFLISFGWVFFTTTSRFIEASGEAISRAELVAPLSRVFTLAQDAESAQRAYLFTEQTFYLARRDAALRALERNVRQLHEAAHGNPALNARVNMLEALANKRVELLEQILADNQSDVRSARHLLAIDWGGKQMNALQNEVTLLVTEQQQIMSNKVAAAKHAGARVLFIFFVALGFALVILLLLMYFIHRALQSRESAYETLARSEEQLKTIVDTAIDGIVVIDEKGLIESFNKSAERIFGYSAEEAVGRNASMLMPSSRREQYDGYLQRYLLTGETNVGCERELTGQRKNGHRFPLELAIAKSNAAGPSLVTGLIRDLSESRRLYEAHHYLASIVESSDDAIVSKSLDGVIQSWNAAAERLFGYTAEEAVGRHISFIIPEDRLHEEDYILASVRSGKRVSHFDSVRERSDGKLVDVSLTISPIRDEAGRIVGASKFARDITERKRAEAVLRESEQRLREMSESLEQQVAARTAQLERQAKRLHRLNVELASAEQRERKRLAALLHDGLQQLLVAARIRLDFVRREARGASASTAIESVADLIQQAVSASRDLTYELRPPGLYEGGLSPALRWLAGELSKLHGLDVVIDAPQPEPSLSDDVKAQLFESVRELLFNVAKHAGVQHASVRVRDKGERLQILVEDAGGGFDAEAVLEGDEFEPGLGLLSIRERLSALGATMTVASIPGSGTSIRLTVPLSEVDREFTEPVVPAAPLEPETRARMVKPKPVAEHRRTRVLVADDHAIVREGLARVLNSDKRIVVVGEAADGVALLEAISLQQPDVVLVDVNMPRMSGVDATREISWRWPNVHIVGISVQDDEEIAKAMREAGAAVFLSKSDEPKKMIRAVLSKRKKRAAQ